MAYTPHILLQFGGRYFEMEEWSCSLRISANGALTSPDAPLGDLHDMEEWSAVNLEDAADLVATWFTATESYCSNKAKLDFVKLNAIQSNGHYSLEGTTNVHTYDLGTSPTGTSTPGFPQNTMVVSLLTSQVRGYANRGRIYTPTGLLGVSANGHVAQGTCEFIAQAAASLIGGINDLPPMVTGTHVVVCSKHGYEMNKVLECAVGDVMDTQRRRRESLPETYWSQAVA